MEFNFTVHTAINTFAIFCEEVALAANVVHGKTSLGTKYSKSGSIEEFKFRSFINMLSAGGQLFFSEGKTF